jgi:outer membrane lipopolysaccharide assembly protein LptE/RlpB
MEDLEKVLQFGQIAAQFGQVGQMALNQEEMIDYIAVKMGVPQELLTTPAEREQMMQEMQQAMAQQQAAQGMIPGAE